MIVGREEGRKTAGKLSLVEAEFREFSEFWACFCGAFVLKVQRALLRSSSVVGVLPLLLTYVCGGGSTLVVIKLQGSSKPLSLSLLSFLSS